ncbi:M1 family metallopeptidase [Phenylobacterium sp.]|uniref:M1 family metallopeptidase n=1 Tax=Phenylobacterium sp. TaxID=1871053 RepID=UPI0011FFCADD|nr:M1 family metallopeptidase [Phenylobacterium sp.]THD58064.1 MAG: M1 family peptidase [Phenylobacterium sp.]
MRTPMRFAAALAAGLLAAALAARASAAPAIPTQLPSGVEPVAYDLTVTPDFAKLTFAGHMAMSVEVSRGTDRLVVNALGLDIGAASIDGAPAKASLDPRTQTAIFAAGKGLSAGRHVLVIDYTGKIADSATGLFHVDYAGGRMLATQFEPSDSRRFMPVFDEPAKKAVFNITAVIPKDLMAISNMPEASSEPAGDSLKRVRFAPTPRMSSYLLFFGVGDMERLTKEVDGTEVSVVIRRGQAAEARYALEAAEQLLPFYNDYFGRKYPLPKLDLVAAPGDVSGSMENWGAILFSQDNVVFDPKLSSAGDRELVFEVVAHEMAHLWSGDLVTMAWWDDLWLNEGFASWMATKATDHFHPEWRATLSALGDKDEAMLLDARPGAHPIVQRIVSVSQAEQAFDAITYKKGEAVIRMLEAYAGPDAWRQGVRAYMAGHAYGNATSDDLWRAIDAAAGKPVSVVARDFTTQPGVPLVHVTSSSAGITLTETRLANDVVIQGVNIAASRMDMAARDASVLSWRAPIRLKSVNGGPDKERVISRTSPQSGAVGDIVNAGQLGYYRVSYDSASFAPLAEDFRKVGAADQLGLLQDNLALGMDGQAPVSNYLRLAAALPADADPVVWRVQARTLAGLDGYYAPGPRRAAYRAWTSSLLAPELVRVGFDIKPGEPAAQALLRETLILALSQLGDPRVAAEALRRFKATDGDLARLSADQRRWVLVGAARAADPETFRAIRALAKAAKDPLERNDLYIDLAAVDDEALAGQVLALSITDEAPTNLAPVLVREVAAVHPQLAWSFTLSHLPAITNTLDTLGRSTFVPRVAEGSNDPKLADQLKAFAAKNIPPDAQGQVQVALARIHNNADIQARRLPQIDGWIAQHAGQSQVSGR